ncbi:MAG: response regulator [Loktanella sp.]|nr:response regulator [Loktanella sp.]
MNDLATIRSFIRDMPHAMSAFAPDGGFLFANGAMDGSAAADALYAYMADPSSVTIRKSGLQRTKPVPFRFNNGQTFYRATIRRILDDATTPALLVQLARGDNMAALTALRRQAMEANDERFSRLQLWARYEAFFNNATDGIGLFDEKGCLTSANPALFQLLDATEDDIIGKAFEDLFFPTNFTGSVFKRDERQISIAAHALAPFDAAYLGGQGNNALEITLSERSTLRHKEFFMVVRNLTLARRLAVLDDLNAELRATQQMRNEFIQLVSHEMRAPLAAVVSAAENLRGLECVTPQLSNYAQIVEDSANDALTQFSAILDLARSNEPSFELFQPSKLVTRLLRQYNPVAERLQVTLKGSATGAAQLRVPVDPARVFLMLTNLLSNALKHAGALAAVTFVIDTDAAAKMLRLEVSDTGAGIPKSRQNTIFDAFETGASRDDLNAGLGVGLALVRTAVKELDGAISFASAEGEGSTFHVLLPFRMQDAAHETKPDLPRRQFNLKRGDRVLIADDDAVSRKLIAARLKALGLAITEAENGEEVIQHFEGQAQDRAVLVFVDRYMPLIDGAVAIRHIRSLNKLTQPVMIGLTAFVDKTTEQDFQAAGADAVVEKPLTDRALAGLLIVQDRPNQPAPDEEFTSLQIALSELRTLIASQRNDEAASLAVRLSHDAAAAGAQADSAFLRSITLRLRDNLPLDTQQHDRLRTLWSQTRQRRKVYSGL